MKLFETMSEAYDALGDQSSALDYLRKANQAREASENLAARARYVALKIQEELVQVRHEGELAMVDERQRIMREIHDGVGSNLITMLASIEHWAHDAKASAQMVRESIDELMLMIDSLQSVEGDLVEMIATLRFRLERRLAAVGIQIEWGAQELPPLPWLDARQALSILRILQEALSNVIKYAHASRVGIDTGVCNEQGVPGAQITVVDDGVGFDPLASGLRGHGLSNMRARPRWAGDWPSHRCRERLRCGCDCRSSASDRQLRNCVSQTQHWRAFPAIFGWRSAPIGVLC